MDAKMLDLTTPQLENLRRLSEEEEKCGDLSGVSIWKELYFELFMCIRRFTDEDGTIKQGKATALAESERIYCEHRLDVLLANECYYAVFRLALVFLEKTARLIDRPYLIADWHWANYSGQAVEYLRKSGEHCNDAEAAKCRQAVKELLYPSLDLWEDRDIGEDDFRIRELCQPLIYTVLARKNCCGELISELDEIIEEEYQPNDDLFGWAVVAKLELMNLDGRSQKDIEQARKGYGDCDSLALYDMHRLIAEGNVASAIGRGEKWLRQNDRWFRFEREFILRMADLYHQAKDYAKEKELLGDYFKKNSSDMDMYVRLKQLYSKSEWKAQAEILQEDSMKYNLCAMQIIDGHEKAVRKRLLEQPEFALVDYHRYKQNLFKLAPELLRDVIAEFLQQNASSIKGTRIAAQMSYWVQELHNYPDGGKVARALLDEWLERWPTRKLLKEMRSQLEEIDGI